MTADTMSDKPPERRSLADTRILHLGKFYPPDFGGMERAVADLVEGFGERVEEVHVACFSTAQSEHRDDRSAGVFRFKPDVTLRSAPVSVGMLRWIAGRRNRYDVVHAHLPNPWALLVLPMLGTKTRIVLHWHSDIVRQRVLRHFLAPLERSALRRCDAVIATSPIYAAQSMALQPFAAKVRVVPIGIDDPAATPVSEADLTFVRTLTGSRRFVFALGRLVYYKGFDVLIDAALGLPDDVCVVIGGSGPEEAALRSRIASLGLEDRVLLPGQLDDGVMRALMQQCALFVLPSISRVEAFGIVQLEAMAHGKCVVSTDIPGSGVPWVNEHMTSGIVVPPSDPRALSDGIGRVLSDPQLAARLGAGGRQRFETRFTKNRMLDVLQAVYEEVLRVRTR